MCTYLVAVAPEQMEYGTFTETDFRISEQIASVISGLDLPSDAGCDEQAFMVLERRAILALAREPTSQARLKHMLAANKPLRN